MHAGLKKKSFISNCLKLFGISKKRTTKVLISSFDHLQQGRNRRTISLVVQMQTWSTIRAPNNLLLSLKSHDYVKSKTKFDHENCCRARYNNT